MPEIPTVIAVIMSLIGTFAWQTYYEVGEMYKHGRLPPLVAGQPHTKLYLGERSHDSKSTFILTVSILVLGLLIAATC